MKQKRKHNLIQEEEEAQIEEELQDESEIPRRKDKYKSKSSKKHKRQRYESPQDEPIWDMEATDKLERDL
jgi:hypothetical protein